MPRRYLEAISVFKANGDNIWYASALEGLATIAVIDAWSAGQGLVSRFYCFSTPLPMISSFHSFTAQLYCDSQGALGLHRRKTCSSDGAVPQKLEPGFGADPFPPRLPLLPLRAPAHIALLRNLVCKRMGPTSIHGDASPWAQALFASHACARRQS